MLHEPDKERLLHIKDAAQKIGGFVAGLSESEFQQSDLVQHGVMNCLYIIGEAATRITPETQAQYPSFDWGAIRRMRNRLAHVYFNVDLGLVWYTATTDMPRLLTDVELILGSDG